MPLNDWGEARERHGRQETWRDPRTIARSLDRFGFWRLGLRMVAVAPDRNNWTPIRSLSSKSLLITCKAQ